MPQQSRPQVGSADRTGSAGNIKHDRRTNQKTYRGVSKRYTQWSEWQSDYKRGERQNGIDRGHAQNVLTSALAGEEPIGGRRKRKLNRGKCESCENGTHLCPLRTQQHEGYWCGERKW